MAMNDEETVALIAGGHTFGKTHGAGPATHVGPEPEAAPLEAQGLGWKSSYGTGKGGDAITSGLEVTWTHDADEVEQQLLREPVRLRMGADEEPGRREAVDAEGRRRRRHDSGRPRPVEASRADDADDRPLAAVRPGLREDLAALPREPGGVRRRLRQGVVQADAPRHGARSRATSARWCRRSRSCGRTPSRRSTHELIGAKDIAALKGKILASGLSISQLVSTAWASAATFRGTDKRGGANGARIRLAPQKDWEVNNPAELAKVLQTLEGIQKDVQRLAGRRRSRSRWPT